MSNLSSHGTRTRDILRCFLVQTCNICALVDEHTAEERTVVTSKPSGSKKRSATDAGINSGVPHSAAKRQRRPPKPFLLTQTEAYAGERLSNSHSISHALNLMVRGGAQDAFTRSTQLTQPAR